MKVAATEGVYKSQVPGLLGDYFFYGDA